MSNCLFKSIHLLYYLSSNPSKKNVFFLLKNADVNLINSITEIFHNLFAATVPLSLEERKILFGRYKKDFIKLSLKTFSKDKKKKLLIKLFPFWSKLFRTVLKKINGSTRYVTSSSTDDNS